MLRETQTLRVCERRLAHKIFMMLRILIIRRGARRLCSKVNEISGEITLLILRCFAILKSSSRVLYIYMKMDSILSEDFRISSHQQKSMRTC